MHIRRTGNFIFITMQRFCSEDLVDVYYKGILGGI